MPNGAQEWIALAIVVLVAVLGLWRYLAKRRARACNDCAVSGCGVQQQEPADEELRTLGRPEVKFTRRAGSD